MNERLIPMFKVGDRPTSWDVLERFKQLAAEEPKRIDMSYEIRIKGKSLANPEHGYPGCGAVGCVGGWTTLLLRCSPEISSANILIVAENRLGLTDDQSSELFYPQTAELSWSKRGNTQNPAYAQLVIDHVTNFQRKYEAQLKRHRCLVGE